MTSSIKRVLITGANKGIGFATVRAVLQAREDTFVFLGSRDAKRGAAARSALVAEDAGWEDRIEAVALDVSRDDSVAAAVEAVAAKAGADPAPLFGIVNNAGIGLGSDDLAQVFDVNTCGPQRVCEAFLPLLHPAGGRIVNVSSASGPMFVAKCAPERQRLVTHAGVTWEDVKALMSECLRIVETGADFAAAGLGDGSPYGLSKACLNAYTIALARRFPALIVNACTPGFIATDLTQGYATASGKTPQQMGMKSPAEGTRASLHLLLGDPGGSGWFFGSDAVRSPLDRYRSPGDPPFAG